MTKPTKTTTKKIGQTNIPVVRDKAFYMNQMDIEDSMFKRAVSIAERIFTAFVRENNIEIKVDANDLADKILERIGPRLQADAKPERTFGFKKEEKEDGFSFDDDEPVVIKSQKIEVKGNLGKIKKSKDSIDENMDVLENFKL